MLRGRPGSSDSGPSSRFSSCGSNSAGSGSTNATSVDSKPGSRSPSPTCKDIRQTSSLQQTLPTQRADRKYNWNTSGKFKTDERDPDQQPYGFSTYVRLGVTSADQDAPHPDDVACAMLRVRTICKLTGLFIDAVNERYTFRQHTEGITKQDREEERANTLWAFREKLSELNVVDTVGGYVSKFDAVTARMRRDLEEVETVNSAARLPGAKPQASEWRYNYYRSQGREEGRPQA
jgi:hypothetical protein